MQFAHALTPTLHLAGFLTAFTHSLKGVSSSAATSMVSSFWQSVLIVVFLALALKLTPRTSASLRFAIWTAAFATIIALPFLTLLLNSAHPSAVISTGAISSPRAWFQLDPRWSIGLAMLWTVASLYRAAGIVLDSVRLHKIWRSAAPVDAFAGVSSGTRHAQLCTTTQLERPAVIGFFAPRILVPEWLYARLAPGELKQIVLHESEHLRRRDDWSNLLQKLALIVFPLNPALIWIERRLCLEREMACDESVVRQTNAPTAYATCLTNLAEQSLYRHSQRRSLTAEALSLGAWQRRPELARRIYTILRRKQSLSSFAAASLLVLLSVSLLVGSLELTRSPQLVAFTAPEFQPHRAQAIAKQYPAQFPSLTPTETSTSLGPIRSATQAATVSPSTAPHFARTSLHLNKPTRSFQAIQTSFKAAARQSAQSYLKSNSTIQNQTASAMDEATGERWIVLTTWGQTATNQLDAQPVYQTTITRMVFRIIPAAIKSSSSSAKTVRSGWLVFQL